MCNPALIVVARRSVVQIFGKKSLTRPFIIPEGEMDIFRLNIFHNRSVAGNISLTHVV